MNESEAERVRAIFALYRERGSLLPVVEELARRGWVGKAWAGRDGRATGGRPFDRTSLYRLLTNVLYAGRVRYKAEVHPGEHPALIDLAAFDAVQATLRLHGATGGAAARSRTDALLRGLLRCGPCGAAMTPTHTTRGGNRRYRYYVCSAAQKAGRTRCPSKAVPAGPVERFVSDRVRAVGRDPALVGRVLAEVRAAEAARTAGRNADRMAAEAEVRGWHAEVRRVALAGGSDAAGRLADLHARIAAGEDRVRRLRDEARAAAGTPVPDADAAAALAAFDPVWEALTPLERARVVRLLVAGVEYDGADGRLTVAFRPTGIRTLADELAERKDGAA